MFKDGMRMFKFFLLFVLFNLANPAANSCSEGYISPDSTCGNNDGIWKSVQTSFKYIAKTINLEICDKSAKLETIVDDDGEGKEICPFESLDKKQIREQAVKLRSEHMLPLICKNDELSVQLGVGFVITQAGFPHKAIEHYINLIKENKDTPCAGLYYSRAQVYQRLGSEHAAHALSDYTEALHFAKPEEFLQIYESRARLFSALNQKDLALRDYGEAIKILPSAQLYYYRGTDLLQMKKYSEAHSDLYRAIILRPEDSSLLFQQATCLYEMNRLKESVRHFKRVLSIDGHHLKINSLIGIAKAKRDLSDFNGALAYYDRALELEPRSNETLQFKTYLLHEHGYHTNALETVNKLLELQPNNTLMKRLKVIILMDQGSFYQAIKLITQLAKTSAVSVDGYVFYPKIFYFREWCRYLHAHLDKPTREFSVVKGLGREFVQRWVMRMDFQIQNYTEQPGLEPHINDVVRTPWDDLSSDKQKLICEGYKFGSRIYEQGARFGNSYNSVNRRVLVASGMASLEIGQMMSEYWSQPASQKNKDKSMNWRKAFSVALKWLRFVETFTPTFWTDKIQVLDKPEYSYNIVAISQNQTKYRYEHYFPHFYKIFIDHLKIDSDHRKVRINSTNALDNLYSLHKEYSICVNTQVVDNCPMDDRMTLSRNEIQSKKSKGEKIIKGLKLSLTSNRDKRLNMTLELIHDKSTVKDYHAELEYIWKKIEEERKKLTETPTSASVNAIDPIINLIITMVFYFVNLMPVSGSGPEIAYSTMVGLFLGLGRETTGSLPKGRELFLEAIIHPDPDKFRSLIRSWLTVKYSRSVHNLIVTDSIRVADTFSTYRHIMEALLYDVEEVCK